MLYIIVLALLYILAIRYLRPRFVDMKKMKELQKKSREISEEYKEAAKRRDLAKMDELAKRQMEEILPEMNKIMIQQMKFSFVIIILFSTFVFLAHTFTPEEKDDIAVEMINIGNNTWVGEITADAKGLWEIRAKTNGFLSKAENISYVAVETDSPSTAKKGKGNLPLFVDKNNVSLGEKIKITVISEKKPEVIADRGTRLLLELPFTIPLLNIKVIEGSGGVFLFFVITLSLLLTVVLRLLRIELF